MPAMATYILPRSCFHSYGATSALGFVRTVSVSHFRFSPPCTIRIRCFENFQVIMEGLNSFILVLRPTIQNTCEV